MSPQYYPLSPFNSLFAPKSMSSIQAESRNAKWRNLRILRNLPLEKFSQSPNSNFKIILESWSMCMIKNFLFNNTMKAIPFNLSNVLPTCYCNLSIFSAMDPFQRCWYTHLTLADLKIGHWKSYWAFIWKPRSDFVDSFLLDIFRNRLYNKMNRYVSVSA